MLKINYVARTGQFELFYKLIFNKECENFDSKKTGVWQNLGEIEVKLFQNGNLNIKGNLKKLKELFFNYLKNTNYSNRVIFYNKKKEIINKGE
jgi:hypothetical protein